MQNRVMAEARSSADPGFQDAPLAWLDRLALQGGAAWAPGRRLCVADAEAGRAVLRNTDGLYTEHTDFFGTKAGTFGPRSAQIAMGHEGRALVEARLVEAAPAALVRELGTTSRWPRAGVELMWRLAAPMLAREDRAPQFREALRDVVAARILNRGAPGGGLVRAIRRFRYFRAFSRERERAPAGAGGARDMLDVVFGSAGAASDEQLIEIYSSFVFAVVSSLGLTLGWSVLLAVSNGRMHDDPTHLVSEAMRLYPVAWFLERRPAVPHSLLGEAVTPADTVVVSPYAIHRNPRHWRDPGEYRPERWGGAPDRFAWTPFGAGAHSCVASALTLQWTGAFLRELFTAFDATVEMHGAAPGLGAALAPPAFVLTLEPR